MTTAVEETWVVYQANTRGPGAGRAVVCNRAEWDALEAGRPGLHTLVHRGLNNEARAEALARAATGFVPAAPRGRGRQRSPDDGRSR